MAMRTLLCGTEVSEEELEWIGMGWPLFTIDSPLWNLHLCADGDTAALCACVDAGPCPFCETEMSADSDGVPSCLNYD